MSELPALFPLRLRDNSVLLPGSGSAKLRTEMTFVLRLMQYGPTAVYAGVLLRKKARLAGKYPSPVPPEFLIDLASYIARRRTRTSISIRDAVDLLFDRIQTRLSNPTATVDRHQAVDALLDDYGLASLPKVAVVEHLMSPQMTEMQKAFDRIMREE